MKDNPEANEDLVEKRIMQLIGIKNCQLGAIMLVPDLDLNEVTEIFVRINSQGKRLNEADFAMSKIAADEKYGGNLLRKAIDYFCHLSVESSFFKKMSAHDAAFMESEYAAKLSWLKEDKEDIYDPTYRDMLRVSFMHQFRRGKLSDLVSLLSGRDFKDRTFKEEIAKDCFEKMKKGVLNFMNEYNFKQFILAIRGAGFIDPYLLNSMITLDVAYALYLLLHNRNDVPSTQVTSYIKKWFVLATLTERYSGSPESQIDKDLRGIEEKGFIAFLKENEEANLSDTFWNINLVQKLVTSSATSPYFLTYLAAQVFCGDRSLFSNTTRVSDLIAVSGDVHHVFPKEYLKKNGFNVKALYNQVANYAYLDTGVNISIGSRSPQQYFGEAFAQCEGEDCKVGTILDREELLNNLRANAIPENICTLTAEDYPHFLQERRILMAQKIKNYYSKL